MLSCRGVCKANTLLRLSCNLVGRCFNTRVLIRVVEDPLLYPLATIVGVEYSSTSRDACGSLLACLAPLGIAILQEVGLTDVDDPRMLEGPMCLGLFGLDGGVSRW